MQEEYNSESIINEDEVTQVESTEEVETEEEVVTEAETEETASEESLAEVSEDTDVQAETEENPEEVSEDEETPSEEEEEEVEPLPEPGEYYYIKKSIARNVVMFEYPLSEEEYNNIGSTLEDYASNMWVALNDEQVAFYHENPTATSVEIFNMALTPEPERTIDDAKAEMIQRITEYDESEAVNSFTIGNMTMWLTVDERQQIATQISANEAVGRTEMTKWFGGQSFTFPIDTWKQMLVALEVYAGDALNVTEEHKATVSRMRSIARVDEFDYTADYPEKLAF